MEISKCFQLCCEKLEISEDKRNHWQKRISKICKKLNEKYYNLVSEEDNMIIVGSVGRNTAIDETSDWDCIYDLPKEIYSKFNKYESNGQSQLLQEVKKEIKKLYSNTNIKADGQVVVISFSDGNIELVPGFKQSDNSYKFPNSNNGGSWKITNPIPEIEATEEMKSMTNGHYKRLCQLMRKWKKNGEFSFKGLLIDTLVKDFIDKDENRRNIDYIDYKSIIRDLFYFLSIQDKNRKYWYALGSNQQINNTDEGKFIDKATNAYNKLKVCEEDDEFKIVYTELFDKVFEEKKEARLSRAVNEQYIEEIFDIDIRYNIKLDCEIKQAGFRDYRLSYYISKKWKLKNNKKLIFKVENMTIPHDIKNLIRWYWKVRNIGDEAKKRNMERGEIRRGGKVWEESTTFSGEHYVECYAVYQNIVIARDKIAVPIDIENGI